MSNKSEGQGRDREGPLLEDKTQQGTAITNKEDKSAGVTGSGRNPTPRRHADRSEFGVVSARFDAASAKEPDDDGSDENITHVTRRFWGGFFGL